MDWAAVIFGDGPALAPWQMAARAVAMFAITLALIRLAGRRSFGQRSAFDATTTVLLGAVLSRAVVGASPFWATVAAAAAMAALHRGMGWLSVRSKRFDTLVTGRERVIVRGGEPIERAMEASLISRLDLEEAIRKKFGAADWARIDTVTVERDGEVSILGRTA